MKKIIGIIFASLMFTNIGFAEITLIEQKTIIGEFWNYRFSTVCIDGYKFVTIKRTGTGPEVMMVQAFEEKDGKSVPAKC